MRVLQEDLRFASSYGEGLGLPDAGGVPPPAFPPSAQARQVPRRGKAARAALGNREAEPWVGPEIAGFGGREAGPWADPTRSRVYTGLVRRARREPPPPPRSPALPAVAAAQRAGEWGRGLGAGPGRSNKLGFQWSGSQRRVALSCPAPAPGSACWRGGLPAEPSLSRGTGARSLTCGPAARSPAHGGARPGPAHDRREPIEFS